MRRFEILAGLPPYGPLSLPFPSDRWMAHSEGVVVRFRSDDGNSWVGNFQPGGTWLDTVLEHPDGRHVIVIASGRGYVVDPETREESPHGRAGAMLFSGQITSAEQRPDLGILLLSDGFSYAAVKADVGSWLRKWVNLEGMRNVTVRSGRLCAEVLYSYSDRWLPIELDLNTGKYVQDVTSERPL